MNKISLNLLALLLISQGIFSQTIVPYKEGRLYGLKEKENNKIIISARYNTCKILSDSLFTVTTKSNDTILAGVINQKGDTVILFNYNKNYITTNYSVHNNFVFETSFKRNAQEETLLSGNIYQYKLDKQSNCIPTDYNPCPVWKKVIDTIPEYLRYIQMGEKFCDANQLEAAIVACFSAINEAPSNPYPYYWGANMLLSKNFRSDSYIPNLVLSQYDALAAEWLVKADSLENRPNYKLPINTLRYNFYRFHKKDRKKSREIFSQTKQYDPIINKSGLCLITGFEYSFNPYVELGIGTGDFSFKPKSILYNGQGAIFFGGSYLKSLTSKTDAMKLYFISILRPIRLGLCLFNYTDYQEISFVLRPEIGFSIKNFTISYGYNFCSKKSFVRNQNRNVFTIRYFIPFKSKIIFITP